MKGKTRMFEVFSFLEKFLLGMFLMSGNFCYCICRSTVAAERKLYGVLSSTFSARRADSHVGNHSQSNPEDTISLTELFAIMAHQKEDFVVGRVS